jgi:hypothetical protein
MTPKPVWLNDIERDAWIEKHCRICFQPDEALRRITGDGPGCPHLARAEDNKLPSAWTRRRNAVMGETYRCADFQKRPAVIRRVKADVEIEPMLDVRPDEYRLVPVETWPDYRAEQRKTKEGDHQ